MRKKSNKDRWIPLPRRFRWVVYEDNVSLKENDGEVYIYQSELESILAKARAAGRFHETDYDELNPINKERDGLTLLDVAVSPKPKVMVNDVEVMPMHCLVPGKYISIVTALEPVQGYELYEGFFVNYILEDNFGTIFEYREFFLSDDTNEKYNRFTEYLGNAGNIVGVYIDLVGVCEELTLARVGDSHVLRICERQFIGNLDYIGQNVG